MSTFETAIDLLFIAGMVILVLMVLVGWLMYSRKARAQQTRVVGANSWLFSASVWSKVLVTLVSLAVSLYVGYLLWKPFVDVLPGISPILRVVGLVLFLAGDFVIIWARWTLGRNWSVSTSFGVQLQTDHQLIQGGPFALVRHPMYTGFWTALIGATLAYHTWAVLLMLLMALAIFYRRAGREEAALADTFGDAWRTYTAHVPRFVPHLR
jgi:protein-S-isoprenylcysteine O-methyltransferase Ste14